jgi:KaiC/GvpD/RAD55 family RecA-like ATPase
MATQENLRRYYALVRKAFADGVLTAQESNKLMGVGKRMGITSQEHQKIVNKVKQEMMSKHASRGGPVMGPVTGQQRGRPSVSSQARAAQIQTKRAAAGQQKRGGKPAARKPPVKKGPATKKTGGGARVTHAPTGAKKLDGMLGGGMPLKASALVIGPPFIGKESFIYQFIMTGLKRGVPVVIVTTDKTGSDIKNKIVKFDREFPLYDKKGLVRIVDCYSNTVGMKGTGTGTLYVNGIKDHKEVLTQVNKLQKHIKEKFFGHRIVVLSLSKFLQTIGITETMNFLNGLSSRNKVYNASCLLDLASGIHPQNEIMAIQNSIEGALEFKSEDQKKYMRIVGLGDIENREWINYESTEDSFDVKAAMGFSYIT